MYKYVNNINCSYEMLYNMARVKIYALFIDY